MVVSRAVISRAVIMPRSGWGPGTLLRVGASTAAVGFLLMVPAVPSAPLTAVLLYVAVGVVAPGTGTATPPASPPVPVSRSPRPNRVASLASSPRPWV